MLTQTELYSSGECQIYWLQHNPFDGEVLTVGQQIALAEDPSRIWIVGQLWLSLADYQALPPKAKTATILAFLQEDGTAELRTVYPKIYVV